ncbi:MAG: HAD family hydrolase [Endozoicomonas sp.]
MPAIEGIFFDLDGTLLDTAEDFIVIINQMLEDEGRPPMDTAVIRSLVSEGSRALMQEAFQLQPGTELEKQREHFLDYYDQHICNHERESPATTYPGALPLIDELERRGIAWGIVTNKPRAYATTLIQQAGLLERTHALVCPDDVEHPKPNPQALLLACQQANCAPAQSVYIGDHLRDIQAGKKAGMVTVAAHYGYILDGDNPWQWQADLNINTLTELHHQLQQLNWKMPAKINN